MWLPAIARANAKLREEPAKPNQEQLPIIRPHDARHTFVAHLLAGGANPVYIKEQAGRHGAAFTLDVYGHLIPSQKRAYNLPTNRSTLGTRTTLRPTTRGGRIARKRMINLILPGGAQEEAGALDRT